MVLVKIDGALVPSAEKDEVVVSLRLLLLRRLLRISALLSLELMVVLVKTDGALVFDDEVDVDVILYMSSSSSS